MQINAASNTSLGLTTTPQTYPQNKTIDESLFVPQGALPDSAYINKGEATVFFAQTTPEQAWQQYAFSTSGSMVEVASTIPAGYRDVSTQLDTMLAEQGLHAPEGMTIRFDMPEVKKDAEEDNGEIKGPVFIVENVNDEALTERIENTLNRSESNHFKQSYLALDKLTASENTRQALQRDNVTGRSIKMSTNADGDQDIDSMVTYGYKQDFSMGFDGNKWLMNAVVQPVELMRIEKITS